MKTENYITAEEFNPEILRGYDDITTPKRGKQNPITYKNVICAFDSETTTLAELDVNFMYIWMFQIGLDYTIIGRTWDEFRLLVKKIREGLDGKTLLVYVHNLSYDFQYLHGVLEFNTEDVFATDSRKVLKATSDGIEFRCSMMLSNMNLFDFTDTWHVEHRKLKEEAKRDGLYQKRLFPWSKLSPLEMQYCVNDVLGLVEALTAKMNFDGDTIATVPLTSTGYVRRDVKKAMKNFSHSRMSKMQPDEDVYKLLLKAYRGGNTHANRFYSEKKLKNVVSFDRSSSYPHVLCTELYPMTPFKKEEATEAKLEACLGWGRAVLVELAVTHCRLKDEYNPCPYISSSKCEGLVTRNTKSRPCPNVFDNGRLIEQGQEEPFFIALTDIDLEIMADQYDFDYTVMSLYSSEYGPLPPALVVTVQRYFDSKTALKGVEDAEMLYNKSKALLNGIYGMMVQKPARAPIDFIDGLWEKGDIDFEGDLEKNKRKAFLAYQWGVWCCAYARMWLQRGIDLVGDRFVYCDTDSVKYIEDPENPVHWEWLNEELEEKAKQTGSYSDDSKGVTHYMGVFELDGKYESFKTLGSKRYAYTSWDDVKDENGKKTGEHELNLHITIAGVNKHDGAIELGDIDNFHDGFIFEDSGKTASAYHDKPDMKFITVEGKKIEIVPYIIITETTYNLSLSEEYSALLAQLMPVDSSRHIRNLVK